MKTLLFLLLMASVSAPVSSQSLEIIRVPFQKGHRSTILLPTAPDATKGRYYRLDRCENYKIVFELEPSPQAHTPYIIVPVEDFVVEMSAQELCSLRRDTASIDGISFVGSYTSTEVGYLDNYYYIVIDDTSDCYNDKSAYMLYVGALRAFLEVFWHKNNHRYYEEMTIELRDNLSRLQNLCIKSSDVISSFFNLQGRRLSSQPQHGGVYIQNGKKILNDHRTPDLESL